MIVSVVMPYGGHDPPRQQAMQYVAGRYGDLGYEVRIGVGDHLAWRKGAAVADAVARSSGTILVVADADVWCDELDQAVDAVRHGAKWAVPYRQVWRLTETATPRYVAGERDGLDTQERHQPMLGGGIVVLHRDTYLECPLDPRFVGWGGEDLAWGSALLTLYGPTHRTPGRLWHLWHPAQERRSRVRGSVENMTLADRYVTARNDPDQIRALIEEGRVWASNGSMSIR